MNPVPPPRPRDAAKPIDDFEWPPKNDGVSVYEVGPDSWQTLQDVSSQVFAARHRERSQPRQQRAAERAPDATPKLAAILTASVIVAAAAAWACYAAMTRPVAIQAFHHPAPAAPPTPAPPRITIFATYPVEPDASSEAPATAEPAVAGHTAIAPPSGDGSDVPRVPIDAAPIADATLAGPATMVDAVAEAPAPGRPEPAGPAVEPAADAATDTPDASIRSLLQRYEDAYDRRDVRTAAALWPSLDQRALTRAFAGLDRQDVQFDRCDIDASEARGSAVCVGTVRYVPSVGRAVEKQDRITWTFDLARSGEDWRIAGLSAH